MDPKLKKYLAKYEFMNYEYEETQELFETYKQLFFKDCPNVLNRPNVQQEEDVVPNDEQIEPVDPQVNRLYKKLSLKIHPDKSTGSEQQFHVLNHAFKTNDILKLLMLAKEYSLDVHDVTIDFDMLDNEIKALDSRIEHFKKTLAWNWAFADESQKEIFRQQYNL